MRIKYIKKLLGIVLTIALILGMVSVPECESSAAEAVHPAQGITVSYRTHVQTFGWQGWKANGIVAGTQGLAKRLEGIEIKVAGANLGIEYTTHVQTYGWQKWVSNGTMSGTIGKGKRLEAIKIRLTGNDASKYDVYYRVHAQHFGWMNWVKNGAAAGTAGYAYRLEAIQIIITPHNDNGIYRDSVPSRLQQGYISKDGNADPGIDNNNSGTEVPTSGTFGVAYRTHVQTFGWQAWKSNGAMSGTSGLGKRLEGINIRLVNAPYSGGIMYRTHVQTYGWQEWKSNGAMSGTSGKAKRLEGIEIKLTGEMANHYDVMYRTHVQTYGWQVWKKNGQMSGTSGQAKRLEGIEIVLVNKQTGKASYYDAKGNWVENGNWSGEENDPNAAITDNSMKLNEEFTVNCWTPVGMKPEKYKLTQCDKTSLTVDNVLDFDMDYGYAYIKYDIPLEWYDEYYGINKYDEFQEKFNHLNHHYLENSEKKDIIKLFDDYYGELFSKLEIVDLTIRESRLWEPTYDEVNECVKYSNFYSGRLLLVDSQSGKSLNEEAYLSSETILAKQKGVIITSGWWYTNNTTRYYNEYNEYIYLVDSGYYKVSLIKPKAYKDLRIGIIGDTQQSHRADKPFYEGTMSFKQTTWYTMAPDNAKWINVK